MRKAFAEPEFPKEFHKLMGDNPAPLGSEELEKAIKELPRDKEVGQLCQKLAGADPLPARRKGEVEETKRLILLGVETV